MIIMLSVLTLPWTLLNSERLTDVPHPDPNQT